MGFFAAFFVSLAFTVVGELLRSKQKPADAKPASIDDFQLPTVSQTRNWPWFAGTCKIDGPNLTWYGDLRTEAIKKKVKTGLFSSTKVTVNHKYYLGAEMFLGIGGDTGIEDIVEIRFNGNVPKYTKSVTTDEIIFSVNDPDFFGGDEEGGGVVGTIRIARGTMSQNSNSYMQTVLGRQRSAYRGLCYAVFERFYWGTRASIPSVSFVVRRRPNTLGMSSNKHRIGEDANPVCMIYELLSDLRWGTQVPSSRVDIENWIAIGNTLYDEGYGLSMLINSARTAKDQIAEILRHIDGVMYEDPETRKLKLALARGDYNVNDLPLFDESSISSFRFSRGQWSQTKNTLMVNYVDREQNFAERGIPLRDSGNIYGRGGIVSADTIDFLGFSKAEPATKRGTVALKTMSYPLLAGKLTLNSREAYKLRPGSVIKVNWPPEDITGLVLRITRIDYGSPMENRIECDCLEDIFSIGNASFIIPPVTGWQNPVGQPQPLVAQYAFEAPYQLVGEQARYIATVGSRFSGIDLGYETWQDAAGGASYVNTGRVAEFTPTGVLADDYGADTDAIDAIGFIVASARDFNLLSNASNDEFNAGESLALIKSSAGEEIVAWRTIVNNEDGTYTLKNIMRGVYDTVPLDHEAGARVWVFSHGVGLLSETPYASNGTVTGKLLPYNIRGVLPIASATQLSVTLSARAWKPYPPANVKINGATDLAISGDAVVTWSIRHRVKQTEDGVVVAQSAANYTDTPEGGYRVKVYIGGSLKRTVDITAAPFDTFTYTPAMRVEDDADVMKIARIGVTAVNGSYSSVERLTQEFYMLSALDPLVIETSVLPSGSPGDEYSLQLEASGGATPYEWTVTSGALPDGLTLSSSGLISGTPTADEEATFTVRVQDAAGSTDSKTFSLRISVECADYEVPNAVGASYDITVAEEELPPNDNELHICNKIVDPYLDNVIALLHFDGTDGSTVMTDATGRTWTPSGDAQIDTDDARFGGGSLLLDGVETFTHDKLQTAASSDFNFGSGDFTIEAFINLNTLPPDSGNPYTLFATCKENAPDYYSLCCRITSTGALYILADNGDGTTGGVIYTGTAGMIEAETWHHVAYVRDGNTLRLFVDGQDAGSTSITGSIYYANQPPEIGVDRSQTNNAALRTVFDGRIDEFRITKGVARYTAEFIPPVLPFQNP